MPPRGAGCYGPTCPPLTGPSFQVRLQVQSMEKPQYRGTLHCFQAIIKQESVSALGPRAGVGQGTGL